MQGGRPATVSLQPRGQADRKDRRRAEAKVEAVEAAEDAAEDASWEVRWSLQGQAPLSQVATS